MKLIRSFLFLAFPVFLFSCGTQKQIPNYIQNISDTSKLGDVVVPELRIQKNDLLSIQVYSASTRPDISDVPYNMPAVATAQAGTASGYLVDAQGNINYPRVGSLHVEGLFKSEAADLLKRKINEKDSVLVNPSVIIRFLNLKITVLGEVNQQGVINIPGEKVTILEAVGLAGGINDVGLKNSVKVIREADGKRQIGVVDLSAENLFESPYYNLKQNDVVLVDPTKRKAKKAEQDQVLQRVGFALSMITAIALLYNIFK